MEFIFTFFCAIALFNYLLSDDEEENKLKIKSLEAEIKFWKGEYESADPDAYQESLEGQ